MKSENSSIKYGCLIAFLTIILLAIIMVAFFLWRAGISPGDFKLFSNFPSRSSSSNTSPTIDQEILSNNNNIDYREFTFLPYDFQFSVPSDWFVGTTEMYVEPLNLKCITYHISSPGDFARLILEPFCGDGGGAGWTCPETLIPIGEVSGYTIGRYRASDVTPNEPGLTYSNYDNEDNYCLGMVSNNKVMIEVTAFYQGPESEWLRYLKELDRIVLSLDY